MFIRMQICFFLLTIYFSTIAGYCPYPYHQTNQKPTIAYSSAGGNPALSNIPKIEVKHFINGQTPYHFYKQIKHPEINTNSRQTEEDPYYEYPNIYKQEKGKNITSYDYSQADDPEEEAQEDIIKPESKFDETDMSNYFMKAYFPELNEQRPSTPVVNRQEYQIKIEENMKAIRIKLKKKIQQTVNDFTHAVKTIKSMLNEETIDAVSKMVSLPSSEFQFLKNVIKILKITMENVVECVSNAGNRLMALPKKWLSSYPDCVVDEFKESWGIVENVHHIFQNAVFYVKNFINKLEYCISQEESLIQWCVSDIFNDVPAYVQSTVTKLNEELEYGVSYLNEIPDRVDTCQMSSDAEKKLLLPFMIIREMVKCVLSKAQM